MWYDDPALGWALFLVIVGVIWMYAEWRSDLRRVRHFVLRQEGSDIRIVRLWHNGRRHGRIYRAEFQKQGRRQERHCLVRHDGVYWRDEEELYG